MADKELGSLTGASTPLDGDELHYVVQGGNSRKVAGSEIVKIAHSQPFSSITGTPTTREGYGITDAASSGQGALADTALQPGDIGNTVQAQGASLDSLRGLTLEAGDVLYATGADTLARLPKGLDGEVLKLDAGLPAWDTAVGAGDMLEAIYDPTGKGTDAFDMGNMVESVGAKILTSEERDAIASAVQPGSLATVATSGEYDDLTSKPTLGTAAAKDVGTEADTIAAGDDIRLGYTRAQMVARSVPAPIVLIQTSGYAAAGDGGGARYKRISAPGAPAAWQVQSSDGAWWELVEKTPNVRMFGAVGDGTTDDSVSFANATGYLDYLGGGVLEIPAGTFIAKNVPVYNNLKLLGVFGATILKVPDGVDAPLIYTPGQVTNTRVYYLSLENLIFDGNAANALRAVATSAVAVNGFGQFSARNCTFRNATGYGLGLQSRPGGTLNAAQTECYLENCYFDDNGIGTGGVGADTYDGLDVKDIDILTLVGVWARRNADRGINLRGTAISIVGGGAEGNGFNSPQGLTAGLEIVGNSDPAGTDVPTDASVFGFASRGNAGAGYSFSNGNGSGTRAVKVSLSACKGTANGTYGVETQAGSSLVELTVDGSNFYGNTSHGVSLHSSTKSAGFTNTILSGNGGSGFYTDMSKARFNGGHIFGNARYAVEAGSNGTRTSVTGGTQVANDNTLGRWKFNSGGRYFVSPDVIDYDAGASTDGDIIASAATVTLPEGGRSFTITGTTTITAITPSARDRVVTLIFTGALTVTHGSLLRLVGGTNKTTANHHTLTIVFDGTSWVECAYAAAA